MIYFVGDTSSLLSRMCHQKRPLWVSSGGAESLCSPQWFAADFLKSDVFIKKCLCHCINFQDFFSTDKLRTTDGPHRNWNTWWRKDCTHNRLGSVSLPGSRCVVVVRTISDQIKGPTDKFLLACINSLLCFVYVHSLSSQSFGAQ